MTDAERRLWWRLRELKFSGGHFRRQATIGPYFADFACHEARLVIEVDGSGHMQPDVSAHDAARTGFLESQGYSVLRFWSNDVLTNTDGVMTLIAEALTKIESGPPPLTPPHHAQARAGGGEGSALPPMEDEGA